MLQHKSNQVFQLIPTEQAHIFLVRLNSFNGPRYIGRLDKAGFGTFICSRNVRQILRNTNSVGIYHSLLSDPNINFKWIVIDVEGHKYYSTKEYFLTKGFFHKNSFCPEIQLYVPIKKMNEKEIQHFERTNRKKSLMNFKIQYA